MRKPVPSFNAQIAQASNHWADFQEEARVEQEEEYELKYGRPLVWWDDDPPCWWGCCL